MCYPSRKDISHRNFCLWVVNTLKDGKGLMLVDGCVLPKVFHSVLEAKVLLETGGAKTINQAAQLVGISRSAYYKYKDFVFAFNELAKERIITLLFLVKDKQGVLSDIISMMSAGGCNILTINQNIPSSGKAHISISFKISCGEQGLEEMIERLGALDGVKKVDFMAME